MESTIIVNEIELCKSALLETFPSSMFDIMLNSQFSESTNNTLNITFPENLCLTTDTNTRIIKILQLRISNGYYLQPAITQYDDRFISWDEMMSIMEYLQIDFEVEQDNVLDDSSEEDAINVFDDHYHDDADAIDYQLGDYKLTGLDDESDETDDPSDYDFYWQRNRSLNPVRKPNHNSLSDDLIDKCKWNFRNISINKIRKNYN